MGAIGSLFDEMTVLMVRGQPRGGGLLLPERAQVVPLRSPIGEDTRRKMAVLAHLPYYLRMIACHVQQADVVYVTPPGDMPFLGMLVAQLLRKRLIACYVGSWVTNSQTTFMNKVTRACIRRLAGGRNVMMALGPIGSTTSPARNMYWISAATVLSRNAVVAAGPDLSRPARNPLRLAYVGRLSPEKGIPYLVEALSVLRQDKELSERSPKLTIIGDGPQRAELVTLVERHRCKDLVRFTGQLTYPQLVEQLLETDVCVLPSLSEGFCKARLDAMLCGVPIITTEVGFGREIVGGDGNRGWVVPPGNMVALVSALRRVLTEPIDWPALRQRCQGYAEGLTMETWAHQIGQLSAKQWNFSVVEGKLHV